MKYTFIDLEPIEYEVLTSILHEEGIHYKTVIGPDYDNYVMKAGYNVTINTTFERIEFVKYLLQKKAELYNKVKTMYEASETTIGTYIHKGVDIHIHDNTINPWGRIGE